MVSCIRFGSGSFHSNLLDPPQTFLLKPIVLQLLPFITLYDDFVFELMNLGRVTEKQLVRKKKEASFHMYGTSAFFTKGGWLATNEFKPVPLMLNGREVYELAAGRNSVWTH